MSEHKLSIRKSFRVNCLERDGYTCKICGVSTLLEVHHIIDRKEIVNGGYVEQNGITLCPECHMKAEAFHRGEQVLDGYNPDELFAVIGSSEKIARQVASLMFKRKCK